MCGVEVTKKFEDYNRWQKAIGVIVVLPIVIPIWIMMVLIVVVVLPYKAIENMFWDQKRMDERWGIKGSMMTKQNLFVYLHYVELIVIVGLVFAVVKLS